MTDFQRLTQNIWFTVEDQPEDYKESFHTREEAKQYAEENDLDPESIEKHETPEGVRSYTSSLSIRLDSLGESFEFSEGTDEDIEAFIDELEDIRDGLDELEAAVKGNQEKVEHETLAHAKRPDHPSPPSENN